MYVWMDGWMDGSSILFTIKFPDVFGTHMIDLGRMKV